MNNLKCPKCQQDFDRKSKLPRILPICGHTYCSQCLQSSLVASNKFICLKDDYTYSNQKGLQNFPINEVMLGFLEDEKINPKQKCSVHNIDKDYYCFDCNAVCASCVILGVHKQHEVSSLNQIQQFSKDINKKIDKIFKGIKISQDSNELQEYMEKQKQKILNNSKQYIQKLFGEISVLVKKKLQEYYEQYEKQFSNKIDELRSEYNAQQKGTQEIEFQELQKKYMELNDQLKNEDIDFIIMAKEQQLLEKKMIQFREKNEEFFKQLADFQKSQIEIDFNAEMINSMVILKNYGCEEEESMLLNQSLQPQMNIEEIPEIEPILIPTTKKDFTIYNDSQTFEKKNSKILGSSNHLQSFSKNYFEDLYQDQKFLDGNKDKMNIAQKSIRNRSISNRSAQSFNKGSSMKKFTVLPRNQNSLQDLKFVLERNTSLNTSINNIKRPVSREVSPTKNILQKKEEIKFLKIKSEHLEKILLKFLKNSDSMERINFRNNTFQCNPVEVIFSFFQHQHLKKELQIDLRKNNLQAYKENNKYIDKLKKNNIKIYVQFNFGNLQMNYF